MSATTAERSASDNRKSYSPIRPRQAGGGAVGPGVLALHVPGGGFHVKAAGLRLARFYENELVSERGAAAVSH